MSKPIKDDNFSVSFDAAAFVKAVCNTAADVGAGDITPAEGNRINAEHRQILKAVKQALECGQMAKRMRRGRAQ